MLAAAINGRLWITGPFATTLVVAGVSSVDADVEASSSAPAVEVVVWRRRFSRGSFATDIWPFCLIDDGKFFGLAIAADVEVEAPPSLIGAETADPSFSPA